MRYPDNARRAVTRVTTCLGEAARTQGSPGPAAETLRGFSPREFAYAGLAHRRDTAAWADRTGRSAEVADAAREREARDSSGLRQQGCFRSIAVRVMEP